MAKWKKPRGNQKRWAKRHLINSVGAVCQAAGNHAIEKMHDITLDHIIPRAQGGQDLIDNLQLACYRHNQAKRDMSQEEFDFFQNL
jgi:5-methylcytosine-specific restriction endonuclease McrA